MSKATLNLGRQLSIHETARSITLTGDTNTLVVRSEPGVGKTGLLTLIAEMNSDRWRKVGEDYAQDKYQYVYIDCSNLQYGDLVALVPDRETRTIEEYIGGILGMSDPRPKVLMFDEVLKLPKSMKPIVTRIMRERTVGARPLPKGTIAFGTSNNAADGIGDNTQAHETNRLTFVQMAKPTPAVWLQWAASHGINSTLMAWVQMNQECLASYTTLSKDEMNSNPYIFNPYVQSGPFVSPRSLEIASKYLDLKEKLGHEVMVALLSGTLGMAAANSVDNFALMEKDMVSPEEVIASPLTARIPMNDIVTLITLFKSTSAIKTQEDMSAYTQYVTRLGKPMLESVWAMVVIKDPRTERVAARNKHLNEWRLNNLEYLV